MNAAHSIEHELLQPPPRRVRLREGKSGKKFLGCVGCFLLPHTIIGVGLMGWLLWSIILMFAGQSVTGQITGRYTDRDSDGDTTYHLQYSYTDAGQQFEKKASVNASTYASYTQGSAVQVKVFPGLPGLPPVLQVPGNRTTPHPFFLLGIALFWNGIMSVFWQQIIGNAMRQKRLVSRGVPTLGRVLQKRIVTGSYGDTHYVRYEYFPHGEGTFTPLPAIFLDQPQQDDSQFTAARWEDSAAPSVPPAPPSPFSSTTADNNALTGLVRVAVTNITSGAKPAQGWRVLWQQAQAAGKLERERARAVGSPGARSRQETVDLREFSTVQLGDFVTVLHHPRRHGQAIVYPFSAFEAY